VQYRKLYFVHNFEDINLAHTQLSTYLQCVIYMLA